MTMRKHPNLPPVESIPLGMRGFFSELEKWMVDVYFKLLHQDFKDVTFTTSDAVPTGGKDGDFHIRVNGASTAIYLNINGSWSAYTNP